MNTSVEDVKAPKWLRRIQENSWEGEILISGGAIFSLLQLSDFLIYIKGLFSESLPIIGLDEGIIFSMITLKWITLNFILHLIVRGYWLAVLCVNSAFPAGINASNLKLRWKYREHAVNSSLHVWLIRLDKICGLIFYSAFAVALFIAGLLIALSLCSLLAALAGWISAVVFFLLLLFYFDLITFGLFRRNELIGKIFYPIYLLFNSITLTFLFRKPLQIISANVKKLPLAIYLIVFMATSLCLSYLSLYKPLNLSDPFAARAFPATDQEGSEYITEKMYLDKIAEDQVIRWYAIESEISDHDYLKIFINYRASYDEGIANANVSSFDKIVTVKIDDRPVQDLLWTSYRRPQADQYGIIAMLPVSDLASGKHSVSVHINDDYFTSKPIVNLKTPFWRE